MCHNDNVNSVDLNPINNNLILTGSSDKTIGLWDIRCLSQKYYSFEHHKDEVLTVKWNRKIETIFATGSADHRLNIWDISKIGNEPQSSEDGPSELLVRIIMYNLVYAWRSCF